MNKKNDIPRSLSAERGVLGSILSDGTKFPEIFEIISYQDFYEPKHAEIFRAMLDLFQKESPIDLLTVYQKLEDAKISIGGRGYLAELTLEVPTASFARSYAKIVKEKSIARKIIQGGSEIAAAGFKGSQEDAENKLLDVLHRISEDKQKEFRSIDKILEEILNSESEGKIRGINTGINCLDKTTIGLKPGHFWVIGGAYKSGKTLLSLEIVSRVARDHKVLFYSLEMNDDDVVSTLLRIEQRSKTKNQAIDAVAALKKNLEIHDNKLRLAQIEAHVLSQEVKPEVVFVDHIGLVGTDDKEIYDRLNRVSRSLKLLAKRAGVCVIALSQISEESIKRKNGSFKGSGDIAADCDVGMVLIKNDESTSEHIDFVIDVRFNRHGRRRKIDLYFDTKRGLILFE